MTTPLAWSHPRTAIVTGGSAEAMAVDVSDRSTVDDTLQRVRATLGAATVFVNHAGISPFKKSSASTAAGSSSDHTVTSASPPPMPVGGPRTGENGPMASAKRTGTLTSETRARLLRITEEIMLADGYAAVSSRSVARAAGVTPALVHYYFATLDDLFLGVLRHRSEQMLQRQERQLATERPLQAFWLAARDRSRTGLVMEFVGLANHRKAIQEELARSSEQFRERQLRLLQAHLDETGRTLPVDPLPLLVVLNAVAANLVLEESIGMSMGHVDAEKVVEHYLDMLEQPSAPPPRARSTRAAAKRPS